MTLSPQPSPTRPVPVGELLERLRAEGFVVSPGQYGRVFTVVNSVCPDGFPVYDDPDTRQTLREMIGPIVCRTLSEQERFGSVFDSVMGSVVTKPTDSPAQPDLGAGEKKPEDELSPTGWQTGLAVVVLGCLAVVLVQLIPSSAPPPPSVDSCAVSFRVQSVRGNVVTFANQSPGVASGLRYVWNFGDGTPPLTTTAATIQHQFTAGSGPDRLAKVTLRGEGCPEMQPPTATPTPDSYNPTPLSFLRLPETSRYTLSNWVPLLLMGLGGLLGAGWWLVRRRQRRTAQRPTSGPFFLSFPSQDDAIQPSPSLVHWAQQLQQREESERHVLAIGPTIRRTIRNGGMPSVQYEAIKRRPRYLILIDDRSAYDQQAKLYAYVMSVLITRSVEMDVFFFHSDPRYLWNENHPKGLPIADLFRLYSTHYLVLVTEGNRLLDFDTGEVATWAVDALGGWTSRALLTPVYPANWHYLEAALSRFFILLPATPDGQFLLRDYLGQPDNVPSFTELLRQFKVLPGTPRRGIFGGTIDQLTIADVRNFLDLAQPDDSERDWLFTWACATAVFPTPDWAITLAIGRALEAHFAVQNLVTSTNILKLTALPWLRQDSIPEPLRTDLLAQLKPDVKAVARKTVVAMLNDLRVSPGSVAYEEQQLRLWEQEYHLHNGVLGELRSYQPYPDLIKDPTIQQKLIQQERIETRYQPAGLLLVLLLPLLLYLVPPRTQVAGVLMPFFQKDSIATDSAVFYNNRAVSTFGLKEGDASEHYGRGILDLIRSIEHRPTFEGVYNLNVSRYNLAVLRHQQQAADQRTANDREAVRTILSPFGEVGQLMRPFGLFNQGWVPDSAVTRQYLLLLATSANNNAIYRFITEANQASAQGTAQQPIAIDRPVDRAAFNEYVNTAKSLFRSPGTREFERDSLADQGRSLNRILATFRPSDAQRDSLISVEAARIVFYSGGPRRANTVSVEAMPQQIITTSARPTRNYATESGSTGGAREDNGEKVRPSTKQPKRPSPTNSSTKQPQKRPPVPSRPVEAALTVDTTSAQPAKQLPEPSETKANAGNNNPPASQQQQQQPVQQTPEPVAIDEANLDEVYQERTQCTGKSALSFALPKQERRTIQLFEIIKLSDAPNLYELTVYCNEVPQTISTKRGFAYVKVFVSRSNQVIWTLYQNAATAK